MKVQTRLSLYSSLVFGIIFIATAVLVYVLYFKNAEKIIYSNLEKISYITALFYLEEDELNSEEFSVIRSQFKEQAVNSYYQIYNERNTVNYGEKDLILPAEQLEEIRKKGKLNFAVKDFFCHGIFYEDNQGDFVVVAKERKEVLYDQINSLLWILVILFVLSLLAIVFLSRWIANIAYRPFRKVIHQVNNISTNDLNVKIESPDTKDELQDLINTFNDFLQQISDTIVIQRNFVNYVSHEFKTPLTSMLGNLEVFSLKHREPIEYEQLAQKLIQQVYQLEEILNTLIIISDLGKKSNIVSQTRIDELIWVIIDKINDKYSQSKIFVEVNIPAEDEQILSAPYDSTQLLMALFNLIENAVKYSKGETVDIQIFKQENKLHILIADKGIGIPPEQLKNISRPFYRAENTNQIQGSGIGLSIALRILEKNGITYTIESEIYKGTKVLLVFSKNKDVAVQPK